MTAYLIETDVIWLYIVLAGYILVPVIIVIGKDWKVPQQKNLVKILTSYLAAVLVGFIEWGFYKTSMLHKSLDPFISILVLKLEIGLVIMTWLLMMKMWG